jgi:hypothetical protein
MQGSRLFACLILILSVPAFACICVEPASPFAWYKIHHGQPTFVGVAIFVQSVSDVVRIGGGRPLLDASGKPIPATVQKVTFQVEESFDGVKSHAVEVYGSGTTCDYIFTAGGRYLVYGWIGEDRKIRAAHCTRTRLSGEANKDLKFLRSLKK